MAKIDRKIRLTAAAPLIAHGKHLVLSERDSLRVLALLEHPPLAPLRLVAAAATLRFAGGNDGLATDIGNRP